MVYCDPPLHNERGTWTYLAFQNSGEENSRAVHLDNIQAAILLDSRHILVARVREHVAPEIVAYIPRRDSSPVLLDDDETRLVHDKQRLEHCAFEGFEKPMKADAVEQASCNEANTNEAAVKPTQPSLGTSKETNNTIKIIMKIARPCRCRRKSETLHAQVAEQVRALASPILRRISRRCKL